MADTSDVHRLRRALVQELESLHRSGLRDLPRSRIAVTSPIPPASSASQPRVSNDRSPPGITKPPPNLPNVSEHGLAGSPAMSPALPPAERQNALQILATEVAACRRCPELCDSRIQTVFGVGDCNARLVFFGEAPGADEDRQGEPFVGRAGQLLTKIIEACTFRRDEVYILNVLKCRPPANRNPTPEEVENCRPYFEEQLETIQPEFICCLGAVAARTLLDTDEPIGRLRGAFHQWKGIPVLATYHPSYLLRHPPAKKLVWDDMKLLMHAMHVKLPAKK